MKILLTNVCAQLAIVALLSACSTTRPTVTTSPLTDVPLSSSPVVGSPSPTPATTGDPFAKGVDKAASAASLAQAAQTPEDWNLVLAQWQRAIAFMKAVPPSSPHYKAAQKLLPSYQQALVRTQLQARRGGSLPSSGVAQGSAEGGVPLIAGGQPSASPDLAKDSLKTMEAAITISALLQQQQEFFAKQKRFAASLAELGTSIPASTPTYSYSTSVGQSKQAIATATAKQDDMPSYTGAILIVKDDKNNDTLVPAICFTSTSSKKTPPPPPQLVGKDVQCPAGASKL
jgi:hypothetical protein